MRRWRPLSRFFRARDPRAWDRCVLVVEELESREVPAPLVFSTGEGLSQTYENATFQSDYYNTFSIFDSSDSGQTYVATLVTENGVSSFNPAAPASYNVTFAGNGTSVVTLSGRLNDINDLFQFSGFTLNPTPFYSGDATLRLFVTDTTSGAGGSGSNTVQVLPVASQIAFSVNASGEVLAPSSGFAFPAGFISLDQWDDGDGSETVTVNIFLDADNPGGFTLTAGGSVVEQLEPGFWRLSGTDPAAFAALLDSIILTPPAGFKGRATLSFSADVVDAADYPSTESFATDSRSLGSASVALRFLTGGSVSLPPSFAMEGGTIDLGGRYTASDPDYLSGDTHTLTLSVSSGTLTLNTGAVPAGLSAGRSVTSGGTTVVLTGTLTAINQFLATAGCMTYTAASSTFAGIVPLTVSLKLNPGAPPMSEGGPSSMAALAADPPGTFSGVAALGFIPVAGPVFPSATSVVTDTDTPVALGISLSSLPDVDGSELVFVVLEGVPTGAAINRGTNLGGGQWLLSTADLAGLIFTPPSGATGTYTLTVKAVVQDYGSGVSTSVAVQSTTFTVTVQDDDVFSPDDFGEESSGFDGEDFDGGDAGGLDEGGGDGPDEGEDRGDGRQPSQPPFAGYTGGGPAGPGRSGPTARSQGDSPLHSPLPHAEGLQSLYAGGEKHPLPPVLPLDQTLPIAGFSDTGGDSFAIIDMIYRDAGGRSANDTTTISLSPATGEAPADTPKPAELVAVVATTPQDSGDVGAPPPAAASGGGEWRVWAAASAIVGAAVAWAWLSRHPNWFPQRFVRRLLRALHRRPTEETA